MTAATESTAITQWLASARDGNSQARDAAFALLYAELKKTAHAQLRGGHRGAFQTTMLVHEAWLKLAGATRLDVVDRHHFFALAAKAMRQVLVDDARRVLADKRGGGARMLTLSAAERAAQPQADIEVLMLDELLERLHALDPRAAQITELRYFGGYEETEIAAMLGVHPATVRRDWRKARAFLLAQMEQGE